MRQDGQGNSTPDRQWLWTLSYGSVHLLAGLSCVVILWLNLLIWPVGFLGYAADAQTGIIGAIVPGTAAADAGVQVGDRIVALYNRPWLDVITAWNILNFVPPPGGHIPITIERNGALRSVTLTHQPPTVEVQAPKIANLILAGLCWSVGYVFGIVRRDQAAARPMVAIFWLVLAAVIGGYVFAASASIPLQTLLQWIVIAFLMPLAVYIHSWFPARVVAPPTIRRIGRIVLAWVLAAHLVLATLLLGHLNLLALQRIFSDALPAVVLASFMLCGGLLRRAYRQTEIAHVRRQVRLIALSCLIVGCSWAIAFLIPLLTNEPLLLADQRLNLIAAGIPLAYVISGIGRDLYRVDRAIRWLSVHFFAILLLVGALTVVMAHIDLPRTERLLWLSILCIVLYVPLYHLARWLLWQTGHRNDAERALNTTLTVLTTTLEQSALVKHIVTGVCMMFHQPAYAFYRAHLGHQHTLELVAADRLQDLPFLIPSGKLVELLRRGTNSIRSRNLIPLLDTDALQLNEQSALRVSGVELWCPIVHHDGDLLGLLLLGMRGDLDPYREHDRSLLRRLLDAAALALNNSATYRRQLEAEETIRQLYQHLQEAQDTTARAIARELHDEIINVNIRLNIEALERLLPLVQDPLVQDELSLVLQSEHTTIQTLRLICEQLHPTGIDDPLGLAAVLRMQVTRVQAQWSGKCTLHVHGNPYPVSPQIQGEAVRIAREALTNALKHANATQIIVELHYPAGDDSNALIELIIRDNGHQSAQITPRPGHWGLQNMEESARSVGGTLSIRCRDEGGVIVRFQFPSQKAPPANNNQVVRQPNSAFSSHQMISDTTRGF